jgi:hypothetical protein
MNDRDMPPCSIFIDKEGRWFHKGAEMVRRDIVRFFYERIGVDAMGRYVIRQGPERCYLEVEDTPFVVQKVSFTVDGGTQNFSLLLSDDSSELLDPKTLSVGQESVLYCKVKEGRFPARFLRPAYYQLAEFVREEKGGFYLPLNGEKHFIRPRALDELTPSQLSR